MPSASVPNPFDVPPDQGEFAALHAAITADWDPRDPYERRWVMELVTALRRQEQLRGLELAVLAAAAAESPPSEVTVKKLDTFARYGARIDKDIGRALQALRVLRDRPDDRIAADQNGTREPSAAGQSPRTREPDAPAAACTPEPERPLNRQQRRALAAMRRKRAA
ncbi:MAG: hypothetical protein AB7I59_13990 [Geminicoccaceae bacterium]